MKNFIKLIPLWFWILIIIAILFTWQNISGWSYSNKLYNIVKNQIVQDEKKIIEELEKQNLVDQKEKDTLRRQVESLKNQRAEIQKERDALKKQIGDIQNAMQNVNVPSDPNALLDLLKKLGLKSIYRIKK